MPLNINDTIISQSSIRKDNNDYNLNHQIDVVDLVGMVFPKYKRKVADSGKVKNTKFRIGGPVPAVGLSLSTGFAVAVATNGSFCIDKDANTSTLLSQCVYTQYKQLILPLQTNIWTKDNKYNIIANWRYVYYPSDTYGLGGYTTLNDGYIVDYHAIKLDQTILRKIKNDLYAGIGYDLNYFWNIVEVDPPAKGQTDFDKYGYSNNEMASGITLNFQYDTRKNSINPEKGSFANVIYRDNNHILGNTTSWQSLIIDLRKYIKLPFNSRNVIAFWNYDWFTLSGKPPYLMLPFTGGDEYGNFGRGYIIGRYRSSNLVYLEGEYRFNILKNGLLGGVVFTNAQSFTEQASKRFETVAPAVGAGIRVKFNKYSRTNGALDYAFGIKGSRGIFVNLGEVF